MLVDPVPKKKFILLKPILYPFLSYHLDYQDRKYYKLGINLGKSEISGTYLTYNDFL